MIHNLLAIFVALDVKAKGSSFIKREREREL
jgi:hypothetical protein